MLAVMILAIMLGVWLWGERRRTRFLALAEWHHQQIVCVFFGYQGPDGEWVYEATSLPQKSEDPPVSEQQQRIDTGHRNVALKYWSAADYPWLPVEPDRPEPN
jgi:hypothetical protein